MLRKEMKKGQRKKKFNLCRAREAKEKKHVRNVPRHEGERKSTWQVLSVFNPCRGLGRF